MRRKIYTTGEFAKLCNTTKATLMLYDKKGILKPDYIGENGYRYYTSGRYSVFTVINIFKNTGASLSDIKDIFDSHDSAKLIKILEEKQKELARHQVEIMQMQRKIDLLLASSENTHYVNGEVYLKYFPEEYFIINPTYYKTPPEQGHYYFWESVKELNDYLEMKNYLPEAGSVDEMVSEEFFNNDIFYPTYYRSKIPYCADDPKLFIKPAGIYAVANFFDEWDNISKNAGLFKKELERRGYRWSGNLFTSDIAFTLLLNDKKAYGYTFAVKIEQ